jgi:flagellar biogenesis protein FliO
MSGALLDARGLVGRLFAWMQPRARSEARLAVLDRVTLAPRQSLALIEAEGRRLLVATSPDAAPTFYALDGPTSVISRAGRSSC